MGKCGASSSEANVGTVGYLGFHAQRGFSFYPTGSGLYQPTDGNLYAPRQAHGMPEFSSIARYEGNAKNPVTFNAATMYKGLSIDDKVLGSYERRREDAETRY